MRRTLTIAAAAFSILCFACGASPGAGDTTQPASGATTTDAATPGEARLSLVSDDIGDHIADGDGFTLYLFTPDEADTATCEGSCAASWPPMLGSATGGDGVDQALIGSVERSDGSTQVTYNGWPLYYYEDDASAGQVEGQGESGVWYVVGAAGDAIKGGDEATPREDYYGDY
jgi:predicted lipoprotein with Yx(FWY)xxD motif